ncbi:U6 snRNA phosphodiesterase Usb1 [Lipomyces tetrasporus]
MRKQPQDSNSGSTHSVPPLPDRFFDQYASAPRVGDDPELHGGRTRQSPHVEGLWPTHVYCEWIPAETESTRLESLVPQDASSLVHSPLGAPLALHVSLSQSIMLATADRDTFVNSIRAAVDDNFASFSLKFQSAEWIANQSHTREFYVLRTAPCDQLTALLDTTNRVCRAMSYPTLEDAGFHVSLAWRLPDQTNPKRIRRGDSDESAQDVIDELEVKIDVVKIKIGRTVYRKELKS